jgi:hypothetical protein
MDHLGKANNTRDAKRKRRRKPACEKGLRAPLSFAEPGPGFTSNMKRVAALLGRTRSLPAMPPDAKLSV